MNTILLGTGLGCVIAAIVGGGFEGFGIKIPLLQSLRRQTLLGTIGVALLAAAAIGALPPGFFGNGAEAGNSEIGNASGDAANMAQPTPVPAAASKPVAAQKPVVAPTPKSTGSSSEEQAARGKWADVQVQYQRRLDLIPNLVATVKGAGLSTETANAVVAARAKASAISVDDSTPSDAGTFDRFRQAQALVDKSLSVLIAAGQNYPDLQSNQNFTALSAQLTGINNRIAVAIQGYNKAVAAYNNANPSAQPMALFSGNSGGPSF
jgi:hypothetical protein